MSMYLRLCTEFYDLDKPREPERAFAFYSKYAAEAAGPILEPMCGSGRFLLPLLERGFDIDGTDASPFMLEACRKKAAERGLQPNLYQQRLEDTALSRRYALVIIPAASFGLVAEEHAARQALERLKATMLPGAKLVLEMERPTLEKSESWPWGGRWLRRPDGATLIISWLGHYDADTGIGHNLHRYELFVEGKLVETELEHFDGRLYEPARFHALLEAAGFVGVRRFKAHEFVPPGDKDETVVFECTRP